MDYTVLSSLHRDKGQQRGDPIVKYKLLTFVSKCIVLGLALSISGRKQSNFLLAESRGWGFGAKG